jgi:branched-chain amino acid transport system ATP-binding protein
LAAAERKAKAVEKKSEADSKPGSNGTVLEVSSLCAGYGGRQVLFDVDLRVERGEVVAIFGHNGAGKTTTLQSVFRMIKPMSGSVVFDGLAVKGSSCAANVRRGMTLIPAEHFVFADLTVLDNLRLGAQLERSSEVVDKRRQQVYEIFPILDERSDQLAGTMSGGQQRMLSIGIALMSGPRMLLLDEPSLGLSPTLVEQMMQVIGRLAKEESLSVLLVEQNVMQTLPAVDRAYFMRSGRMILEESSEELRKRDSFWELF